MVEFGEQLRRAREDKGMTQQTLADKLFVTRPTVSRWERGERYPDLPTTKKISEILDVSLDDLLSGKDMKEEVERNPVVENRAAHNAVIALYAFVIFSCLVAVVYYFVNDYIMDRLLVIIGMSIPQSPEAMTRGHWKIIELNRLYSNNIFPIIRMVMQISVFSYGLHEAIKETLTPKRTGGIIVIFLAVTSLLEAGQVIAVWLIGQKDINYAAYHYTFNYIFNSLVKPFLMDFSVAFIPTFLAAIFAFMFFVRKSNKIIAPLTIILVSILEVILYFDYTSYWIGYCMRRIEIEGEYLDLDIYNWIGFSIRNVIFLILVISIYALIIFQTVVLWIKRKNVDEAIKKFLEGEVKESICK